MILFPEVKTMYDLYRKFLHEQWDADEIDYSGRGITGDITGDYGSTWIDLRRLPSIQRLTDAERELLISEHSWTALCTSVQGEDFAARLCASEAEEVPERDARMALALQVTDEVRHYETGMMTLSRRYGDREYVYLQAREKRWKELLSHDYMRKLVGFHVITEGLAMGRFKNREVNSRDPVIREMYRRTNLDEGRHTALGILYLSQKVKSMTETERRQLEDYVLEKLVEDYRMYTEKMFTDSICGKVGLDAYSLTQEVRQLGLDEIVKVELNRRVMPKLKQLRLLPDRLAPRYKQYGFFVDNRMPPTNQMQGGLH